MKTLSFEDITKPKKIPVKEIEEEVEEEVSEDLSLLEILEKLNAFVENANRLTESVKELISNLAENADKLMLPEGIASKLQMFQSLKSSGSPAQIVPSGIDTKKILEAFEKLPDDMKVGDLKKMVNEMLGGEKKE